MLEVAVYKAHRLGKPQEGAANKRAIVCTVIDAGKWRIILDISSMYLKGTLIYVSVDHAPKQLETRREKYAGCEKRQGGTPPFKMTKILNGGARLMGHVHVSRSCFVIAGAFPGIRILVSMN